MNVRKQRTHQCGLTNIDHKTKGDTLSVDRYNPTLKFTDMGTMGKTNFKAPFQADTDPKEKWKTQGGWLSRKTANPITDDAETFYNESKKTLKRSVNLGHRHAELQVEKWTDKVFVGDNVATTAELSQQAGKRHDDLKKSRAVKEAAEAAARAEAENTKIQPEATLASVGVDLRVVKDIRMALRRKYASRSNVERIFQQWDKSHSGAITAEDLCAGLNKIGIKSNLEEAMALKASVHSGDLNLDQFKNLIFSTDERLAVDLAAIKAPSQDEKMRTFETIQSQSFPRRLDLGSLNASELQMFRQRNAWRNAIKKGMKEIMRDLLVHDKEHSNQVEPHYFMRILNRKV